MTLKGFPVSTNNVLHFPVPTLPESIGDREVQEIMAEMPTSDEIESIVCVLCMKDGGAQLAAGGASVWEIVGMLEQAKQHYISELNNG